MRTILLALCFLCILGVSLVSSAPTAFASASIRSRHPNHPNLVARFTFEEDDAGLMTLRGLITGWGFSATTQTLGLHIHDYADISTMLQVAADGKTITGQQGGIQTNASVGAAVGGHYNPDKKNHSCWDSPTNPNYERHAGDIGNIVIGAGLASNEVILLTFNVAQTALFSLNPDFSNGQHGAKHSVIGRAIVLHSQADDCVTQPNGNAGAPIGAGVIGVAWPQNSLFSTPSANPACTGALYNYPNTSTNGNGNCNKADYESIDIASGANAMGNPTFNGNAASAVAVLFKTEKYYFQGSFNRTLPSNPNLIGTEIGGVVRFQAVQNNVVSPAASRNIQVRGAFAGLAPNTNYGVHIHLWGDDSDILKPLRGGSTGAGAGTGAIDTSASTYDGAMYSKGHWNPQLKDHSADINNANRHAGDLGNIKTDANGVGLLSVTVDLLALGFNYNENQNFNQHASIIGRSIVVHSGMDTGAQPVGGAGTRQMIGVIGLSNANINVANAFINQYVAPPCDPCSAIANASIQWIVFIVAALFAFITMQY